jgi:predicted N-acetyltransferase YhbS
VGNIMYSRSIVVSKENLKHDVITFGPISVLPAFQKNGIGSALIEHTKSLAHFLGYKAIIIFGNPDYYHRFGFRSAESFGITTSDGANFDAFMAIELYDGALQGITGRFFEDPVFDVGDDEVEAFEKNFSYKEKHVTNTQFK